MKRLRLPTACAATAMAMVLSGCAAGAPLATQGSAPAPSVESPSPTSSCHLNESTGFFEGCEAQTEAPSAEPSISLDLKAYSSTLTGNDGYRTGVTVQISSVVDGRDQAALAQRWAAVGGAGEVPCSSGTPEKENPNFEIDPDVTGYAFGTLQMSNETESFAPKDLTWFIRGLGGMGAAGIGFSSGSRCKALYQGFNFSPKWVDDVWGPVPLVIAVYDYRSPTHPDGDPATLAQPVQVRPSALRFPLTAE